MEVDFTVSVPARSSTTMPWLERTSFHFSLEK